MHGWGDIFRVYYFENDYWIEWDIRIYKDEIYAKYKDRLNNK